MLDGMIVSGYQVEALAPPRNCARPGTAALDMYPAIDEYDDDDLAPVPGMRMKDGSGARFFSSARPNVVLRHFEWMRTHGIQGAFNHSFMANMDDAALHDTRTMVLPNVQRVA